MKTTKQNLRLAAAGAALVVLLFYMAAQPQVAQATFAGSNGRISFARFFPATATTKSSTSIFTARSDGSDQQQLTFDSPGQNSVTSNWSPDGSHIAFDSDRNSSDTDFVMDIFTMKADGAGLVQLTPSAGFNGEPNYKPDGKSIAFESDQALGSAGEGIYLMNASDGSNVRRVTTAPVGFDDVFPHFSPAGTRIAFTRTNNCHPPTVLARRAPVVAFLRCSW